MTDIKGNVPDQAGRFTDGRYCVKGLTIFRSPRHTPHPDGGITVSMGFPVCEASEWIGAEGAEIIAKALNGEAANSADKGAPANANGGEPWVIRKGGAFYRANRCGYTNHIEAAGIYTREEAEREASFEPHNISAIPLYSFRAEIIRSFEMTKRLLELLNISTA